MFSCSYLWYKYRLVALPHALALDLFWLYGGSRLPISIKAPNRLEQLTVNWYNQVNWRSYFGNCNQWLLKISVTGNFKQLTTKKFFDLKIRTSGDYHPASRASHLKPAWRVDVPHA